MKPKSCFVGRFDLNHSKYECPHCLNVLCTSNPLVVIQLGLWPGSVSDMTYMFDESLFQHWNILQKEAPGISQSSFIKSLEIFSKKRGRVCTHVCSKNITQNNTYSIGIIKITLEL